MQNQGDQGFLKTQCHLAEKLKSYAICFPRSWPLTRAREHRTTQCATKAFPPIVLLGQILCHKPAAETDEVKKENSHVIFAYVIRVKHAATD